MLVHSFMEDLGEIIMNKLQKKSFLPFLIFSVFMIFSVSSCKTTPKSKSLRPVYITNSKKVNLLAPGSANIVLDQVILLEGSFGKTDFNLMSYTLINLEEINLSLFNEFGTDMGFVSYNGEAVFFDSAYFPKALPGEYIICDIQNAFYSFEALKANYANSGLIFEQKENCRRILDGKNLIEEISFAENTVEIKNLLRGYSYKLTIAEGF